MIPAGLAIAVVVGLCLEALFLLLAEVETRHQERAFWERQRSSPEPYDWAKELDL